MYTVEPMIMFLNDSFRVVMESVQSNTITLLFSTIAFMGIYVAMVLMIVDKCFGLIHVVPDRVLRWLGADGALTGEEKDVHHKGEQMVRAAGQQTQTIMMGRMAPGGVAGAGMAARAGR